MIHVAGMGLTESLTKKNEVRIIIVVVDSSR